MPSSAHSHSNADCATASLSSSSEGVLEGLLCTPSRRSLKFTAGPHARHFLAFDTAIAREERVLFFMEVFAFRHLLVETAVVPGFAAASYTPEELLEVRVVTDPRHPAYGQAGLYAKSAIPLNTIVTSYSGFIEVFATSCNSRTYTMGFGSIGDDYALDAEFVGNYGRYANDPRGVGTLQPNLSAENRFNSRGESFTALVARRQISAGEEILMAYGKAHGLSATPWTTMQGEPIMRTRVGGVVPFPTFRTQEAPPLSDEVRSADGEAKKGVVPLSAEKTTAVASGVDVSTSTSATATASDQPSSPAHSRRPLQSIANDLVWECTQCGMWTLCESAIAETPLPCSACGTPKLSGARLVSLLSSPAITQDKLLAEAGLDASEAQPSPPSPSTFSSSAFSSQQADWPMNVPFLPWQVWDAAVPLSVLSRHSRFETQRHLCLYTVDTGLGGDEAERRRGRRVAAAAGAVDHGDNSASRRVRQKSEVPHEAHQSDSDDSRGDDVEGNEEDEKERDMSSHALLPPADGEASGSGARQQSKRGDLWQRQGDLDPEDLARLHNGVSAAPPLSPASSLSMPLDAAHAAGLRALFALSPRQQDATGQEEAARADGRRCGSGGNGGGAGALLAESPLTRLMASSTQELDRLLVLRRRSAFSRCGSDSRVHSSPVSAQVADVRRRLQCMTRRLFTGKAFHPGDVVSFIGGLVRQRDDTRCRVSDSCLEIPLRFFLPPRLRQQCGVAPSLCSAEMDSEAASLHNFCQHMDGMSLVVTNEFMYCPCVVYEEAEKDEGEGNGDDAPALPQRHGGLSHSVDEVESALSSCNVALVLTLDALGCPFACAVATKPIGAFEPLLARAQ